MRRLLSLLFIGTFVFSGVANSTTVIPPTFESLVSSANTIFVGEVTDVRSEWIATRDGRAIITKVTFKVEDAWKGAVGAMTQLEFLGGTVGETTMEVVGMPTFRIGQRSVLFVSGDADAVSPLVGFYHGRLRIEKDPYGVDRVRTYDGRSLGNANQVGANKVNYMLSVTAMRLTELETAVRARVAAGRAR